MAKIKRRRPAGQHGTCANISSALASDIDSFNKMRVICEYYEVTMAHLLRDLIKAEFSRFELLARENNPRKLAALKIIYDVEIPNEELEAILRNKPEAPALPLEKVPLPPEGVASVTQ